MLNAPLNDIGNNKKFPLNDIGKWDIGEFNTHFTIFYISIVCILLNVTTSGRKSEVLHQRE